MWEPRFVRVQRCWQTDGQGCMKESNRLGEASNSNPRPLVSGEGHTRRGARGQG
jgi:hypothetical protein